MQKTVTLPLFKQKCYFFIGQEEFEDYCKKTELPQDDKKLMFSDGLTAGNFIWLKSWESLGVVVHEIYHLISNIKAWIGFDDQETEAYSIEFIFDWYYKNIFIPLAKKQNEMVKEEENGRA